MDEHVLAERLITYDTASGEGLRAAAGFVKGWLESRELKVDGSDHDGLPVILAEAGPADGPTVVFHGHLDVVPAREGQFTPRVDGDRLIGRGAYDMKGALAAMMCALKDVAAQDQVRVRFVCVPDEESEDVSRRSTDVLVKEGLRADFALTGEPTDLHIGVQAKGVLALRLQVSRHRRSRLDPVARRQRDPQGPRRLPAHRDAALQPGVLRPLRPPVDQPRPDRRRRRLQQGPRRLHHRRRHPLPAQPGPRRHHDPDPRDRRPRDRQVLHARAGHRLAPQRLRAARCATRSGARSRAMRCRSGATARPTRSRSSRRASRRSSSAPSAAGTTVRTSGCRSPPWRSIAGLWATSSNTFRCGSSARSSRRCAPSTAGWRRPAAR